MLVWTSVSSPSHLWQAASPVFQEEENSWVQLLYFSPTRTSHPLFFPFSFLHLSGLCHLHSSITCCRGRIAAAAPELSPFSSLQLQQLFVGRSPLLFPLTPPHDVTVCSTKQEQYCTSRERSFWTQISPLHLPWPSVSPAQPSWAQPSATYPTLT